MVVCFYSQSVLLKFYHWTLSATSFSTRLANERVTRWSYVNLFIQKGTFHSHTCIHIVTIDGGINDLKIGRGGGKQRNLNPYAFGDETLRKDPPAASVNHPWKINTIESLVEFRTRRGFSLMLSISRPVLNASLGRLLPGLAGVDAGGLHFR